MMTTIEKESIGFLRDLAKNNNREWFNAHKDRYFGAHANVVGFAEALLVEMNKHDQIETATGKESLFRIYADVRFSKSKLPYHTYWGGGFRRATKKLRGGYYFNIAPGDSYVVGGFWGPNPDDMKRIRQDIEFNYEDWKKLLKTKALVQAFGGLSGNQLSTVPRGYDKAHPAIELLRYKQFLLRHDFSDAEVLAPDFYRKVNEMFKKMRPFLNYMSEVLTTDANGESIL